ncbi:MAG: hypothetical protein AAGD25_06625 [Cyanobacteria bacterium P01_F01_bin.150]
MAWANDSIKLPAAQRIFPKFQIEPHKIDGNAAFYTAEVNGQMMQSTALTVLCERIVKVLMGAEDEN